MENLEVIRKKTLIDTIYIPDYPEMIYKVPIGRDDVVLIVRETPEYGFETEVVKVNSENNPFNPMYY